MIKNSPTWALFCVNDEALVDVKVPRSSIIHCVVIDQHVMKCWNKKQS